MAKQTENSKEPLTVSIKIWSSAYRPFILGGNVHSPICTTVEAMNELHDLGKGCKAYLVTSPTTGKTYVVESTTLGIVGASLEQVRRDVSEAGPKLIKRQLEQEARRAKRAIYVSNEEFWRGL